MGTRAYNNPRFKEHGGYSNLIDGAFFIGGAVVGLATARFMGDQIAAYQGTDYGFHQLAALGALPGAVGAFAVPITAIVEYAIGNKVKYTPARRMLYGLAGFSAVAGSAVFAFSNPLQGVPRHY